MSLSQFQYNSGFVSKARDAGWLENLEFNLIDVGVSEGIDDFWRQFSPGLSAVGFDPLVSEMDRLNQKETDPKIRYVPAWVGAPGPDGMLSSTMFGFTSAQRAADKTSTNYIKEQFNAGQEIVWAQDRILLDDWVVKNKFENADVIKVDTDSYDYFVLTSAKELLTNGSVLAVLSECQFHEPGGCSAPVFGDIDIFMRQSGYRLFNLDVWHYTRAELPGRFRYDILAQTETGQVQFCDALYMLDPTVDSKSMDRLLQAPDKTKLHKLIYLYESFGLPDCAAALIVRMQQDGLDFGKMDPELALNWLVPENPYGAQDYRSFMTSFDADPKHMMPSRWTKIGDTKATGQGSLSDANAEQLKMEELEKAKVDTARRLRNSYPFLWIEFQIRNTLSMIGICRDPGQHWPLG